MTDLKTDRSYLWNRKLIPESKTSKNENFKAQNLVVKCDKELCHEVNEDGKINKKEVPLPEGIMRTKDSPQNQHHVEFDGSLFVCRAELEIHRSKYKFPKEKQRPENLTPAAL